MLAQNELIGLILSSAHAFGASVTNSSNKFIELIFSIVHMCVLLQVQYPLLEIFTDSFVYRYVSCPNDV